MKIPSASASAQALIGLFALFMVGCSCGSETSEQFGEVDMSAEEGSEVDGGVVAEGCGLNTCASQGAGCGIIGDGCGSALQCGMCATPQTCGGGGTLFQCGGMMGCVPRTCAQIGATCGQQGDGCGGVVQCGVCTMPATCGGGGVPNACGGGGDGGVPCTGLCLQQMVCPSGTTTLSGTVLAGTDPARFGPADPVPNVLVYVPNAPVQPFTTTVTCDQCGAAASGSPLVTALTNLDGTFQLQNVPCGTNIPLVVQLGRWRRQVTIPNVACCAQNTIATSETRLPRDKTEGDIPHIALSTGNVDALECVLRKMGIADSEFTNPNGNGRVHLYKDNGTKVNNQTPGQDTLVGDLNTLKNYDMVLFPCGGRQDNHTLADQQRVIDYTNAGGRIFTTHFSYAWLVTAATGANGLPTSVPAEPQPFAQTANWKVNQLSSDPYLDGIIDTTFAKGIALAQWLQNVGASTTLGKIRVKVNRRDLDNVIAPSQRWMSSTAPDPEIPTLHYTFNTPVGVPAAQQCGRAVFSDFHVETVTDAKNYSFPGECFADAPLTAQEKLLEFMLFDLASCVSPDQPMTNGCTPLSCQQIGVSCGPAGDGCGNLVQCGDCVAPDTCGGGGTPGQCGHPDCTPRTCAQAGAECGIIGDGCGNAIDCGPCPPGTTCGGTGIPNSCGGIP